jgi:O-antigen/teichoic acid export membrane protein
MGWKVRRADSGSPVVFSVNSLNMPADVSVALTTEELTQETQHPVVRNALFLAAATIVGTPLSILTNAVTARYLGPAAFGYIYLGTTFNAFGFLAVEWGLSGVLPALVAADRTQAGRLLGTSLVWRALMSVATYFVLMALSLLLGYPGEVRTVISLVFIGFAVSAMSNAGQWTILGLERADVAAYRQVFEQFVTLLIVAPILVLGGGVNAAMTGHAAATVLALIYICSAVRASLIGRLSFEFSTLKMLLRNGTPFVFMSLVMVLQPVIDAAFLSKLAPAEVVGWHSAVRRLVGFLVFPAASLVGALYPTLCRLRATDSPEFVETVRSALRATTLLVVPVAVGCLLYPDIGIALFDKTSFRPAEDNLRAMSLFLFLLYFTMIVGVSIIAAGQQRAWSIVQASCVAVSVVLDPILIPWFQRRTGNGGLGLCTAAIVAEIIVLICGVFMAERGVFDRRFARSIIPAVLSGFAMIGAALVLQPLSSFAAAPLAVGSYVGVLWLTGGIDASMVMSIRGYIDRKLSWGSR